jgi:hypothetical protein
MRVWVDQDLFAGDGLCRGTGQSELVDHVRAGLGRGRRHRRTDAP